jgi:hypothetical protein
MADINWEEYRIADSGSHPKTASNILAGAVTRSQVIHEAFVLAGLLKAGRFLSQVELERGELHLRSIMNGFVYREDDISDLTRQLAMQICPILPIGSDVEREEETLP